MNLICAGLLVTALAGCGPKAPDSAVPNSPPITTAGPTAADTNVLTVEQVKRGLGVIGDTVTVRGRCLGNGPAGSGPPPVTRSDWQLEGDSGARVWVVGAYPVGCTGTTPAGAAANFRVIIAEDHPLPGGPKRWYLRRL